MVATIDELLSSLTPETVGRAILDIAAEARYAQRDTIAVGLIADRLLKEHGYQAGIADSLAHARVAQRIAEQLAHIEGMRHIEND